MSTTDVTATLVKAGGFRLLAVLCSVITALAAEAAEVRTMGLMQNDSGACVGYTLFAPVPYNTTYLIDINGELVQSWQSSCLPALSALLTDSGDLLRAISTGDTNGVEDWDWDGRLQWSLLHPGRHHDVAQLPGGNILMIVSDRRTRQEALAAGRDPELMRDNFMLADMVVEFDPRSRSVVWEWRTWDHLVQDFDPARQNYGPVEEHPELVDLNFAITNSADWMHSNSVTYNPEFDQIMISVRYFSEVWVIDHGTTTEEARGHTGGRYGRGGDLLYRWGNPQTYRRGDSTDQRLYWQHDAQWIGDSLPGSGNILVFNNGNGRPGREFSSVDELRPPVDGSGVYHMEPGAAWGPESLAWTYRDTLFSSSMSGCQRLPNGNTIACYANMGMFTEVTADGRQVWRYVSPVTALGPRTQGETIPGAANRVFKVRRYSPDYPAFAGRNMTPRGPIELYPQSVEVPAAPVVPHRSILTITPTIVRSRIRLAFSLTSAGQTRLAVFGSSGVRVATLVDGQLPVGEYSVDFNASDMPAGSYFCTLRRDAGAVTRRFVVPGSQK